MNGGQWPPLLATGEGERDQTADGSENGTQSHKRGVHENLFEFDTSGAFFFDEVGQHVDVTEMPIKAMKPMKAPRRPSEMMSAAMEICCKGTPRAAMPRRVIALVSGIATATTSAVRQSMSSKATSKTTMTASMKQRKKFADAVSRGGGLIGEGDENTG